jgi:transcriptional regulator with XRE-family HTH domain
MERARLNTPLKAALEEDGRKQSWLAQRVGVDARQVWGWVHGLHVPGEEYQRLIAVALQRNVEDLFPPEIERVAA